jgi:hypothetical protein
MSAGIEPPTALSTHVRFSNFTVSGTWKYVTPPSVSFYPPPPLRPVGITDRSSPNFYVLHQHRLASPPRGYVGDPGSGGGSNGDNSNGGAQNGSNQNGVSGGNSGNGGDSGSGGGWSGDPNNGNGGSGGGSNGGGNWGNGGDSGSGGGGNGDANTVTAAAGLPTTKEVAHRPHPVAPRDMYGERRTPPILSASLLLPARKPSPITAKPRRARRVAATTALTLANRASSGARHLLETMCA